VALDVRPPSASSSSTRATKSSGAKSSSTDLFSKDLAAAKQSAASAHEPSKPAPKPAATSKSDASGTPKPAPDADASKSKPSAAAAKSNRSATTPAADAKSGQDASATDDAAAASSANVSPTTNIASKSRAPTRATPKANASASTAAKGPGDAIDDPSADTSNQSGLSLLQLFAQSLQSDNATNSAADTATDEPAGDRAHTTSNDPNAAALAISTQALAAALAALTAMPQGVVANSTATEASGGSTASVTEATPSSNGASLQDLVRLIAQTVAADTNGQSVADATQLNADPTKSSASDPSTADTTTDATAAGPGSLAHLGVASHFPLPHTQNDTHAGELESPVGSAAWDDELGSKLTWMTQNGLETGSLRVSPEHLGPVEVRISVQNGAASVWFGAGHPDTRAALEQALPRLREMFASQGMTLTDSGVSRESPAHHGSRNPNKAQTPQSISGVTSVGSADVSTVAAVRMSLGLVDTYA
jgi:flagellar hook-length control protein FliK